MITGERDGYFTFFRRTATGDLTNEGHIQANGIDIQTDNNSWPCVCDYNDDGKKDLLVGQEGIGQPSNVFVYLNQNTNAVPVFDDPSHVLFNGSQLTYYRTIPVLQDLDIDGKNDMVLGGWYSDVRFYTNVGTNANPVFTNYIYVVNPDSQNYSNGNPPRLNLADWDGDGDLDMITCDYYGSVFLRENVTPTGVAENTKQLATSNVLSISPNPFRHQTEIRYEIRDAGYGIRKSTLAIYDAAGTLVKSFDPLSSIENQESRISWSGVDDAN
ncbi:hypothetical protein KAS45_06785, partial [candidate division WOR-3 bacterium]|nr:hypothetical protein [candidate division WOR-3 bacterium]